jgi:enoyl-CoA hydratase/carnithine racemase
MEEKNILLEKWDDHVTALVINRPADYNTFNTPMALELEAALRELDRDPEVRVVVIKGAGKVFSAGIDVKEYAGRTPTEYKDWVERMERPLITVTQIGKPVIAQVHGAAVANGCGLAASADVAIAADDAKFGLTAIKIGLSCLGPIVPVMKSIGRKHALELLLYGDLIDADRAVEIGLINRAVPAGELEDHVRKAASALAEKSPAAVQLTKKAFYIAADQEFEKAYAYMNEAFARLCTCDDAKEGVAAFLEKRKAEWKGR